MEYHEYDYNQEFTFEAGGKLPHLKVAYHTSAGSAEGRRVIWICHALTANSDTEDWWPGMVGSGKVIDTDRYFVVCVNMIGSCYGSSGPSEPKPSDGRPYMLDFPAVTVRDMVQANILIRKHLGVEKIDLLIGSSIGGFQAVEWLVTEPEVIVRAALMATSARVTPWLSAWEEAQRMALEADASFRHPELMEVVSEGKGLPDSDSERKSLLSGGREGLKAARALALISYRSYEGYNRTQQEQSDDTLFASRAASYERYQGRKLADRFDAYSYYSLSRSVDSHNVGRGRGGVAAALSTIRAKVTVAGIDSDCCFPPGEVRAMAGLIPGAEYREMTSAFGHDGFLLENEQIGAILGDILQDL